MTRNFLPKIVITKRLDLITFNLFISWIFVTLALLTAPLISSATTFEEHIKSQPQNTVETPKINYNVKYKAEDAYLQKIHEGWSDPNKAYRFLNEQDFFAKKLKENADQVEKNFGDFAQKHPVWAYYLTTPKDMFVFVANNGVPVWVVYMLIIVYVLFCFPLMILAVRFGESPLVSWIPILNLLLLLKISNMSGLYVFLFFIPGINIILLAFIFLELAQSFQKPQWLAIIGAVPILNILLLWYFAFDSIS